MHVVESGFQPGEAPLREIVAGQMSALMIGCDHRPHDIDGLNSLVDQHRSIATNVHRIARRRQSTNVLTNDQTEAPKVRQRRTTRRRPRSMRSCDSEDGVGPSTSNHRPAFTGHASSSYPDQTFSVGAPESYHVPDQLFTGRASTSYSIPQYLPSGIAVADPFISAPPVSEYGNVQEDCYIPQSLQQNEEFPFTPLEPHGEFLSGQVDVISRSRACTRICAFTLTIQCFAHPMAGIEYGIS